MATPNPEAEAVKPADTTGDSQVSAQDQEQTEATATVHKELGLGDGGTEDTNETTEDAQETAREALQAEADEELDPEKKKEKERREGRRAEGDETEGDPVTSRRERERQLRAIQEANGSPELNDGFEVVETGNDWFGLNDDADIKVGDKVIAKFDDGITSNSAELQDALTNVESIDGARRGQVPDGQGGMVDVIQMDDGTLLMKSGESYIATTNGMSGSVIEGDRAREMYETQAAKFRGDNVKEGDTTTFQADGVTDEATLAVNEGDVVINGANGEPLVKLDDSDKLGFESAKVMVDLPEEAIRTEMQGVGTWSQIQDADGGTTEVIQTDDGKAFVKKGDEYFAVSENGVKTGEDARLAFETQANKFRAGQVEVHEVPGNSDVRATIGFSDNATVQGTAELVRVGTDGTVTTNIPQEGANAITNEHGTYARLDNGTQIVQSADGTTLRNADGTVIQVSNTGNIETLPPGAEAAQAWKDVSDKFNTDVEPRGTDGINDEESWDVFGGLKSGFESAVGLGSDFVGFGADMIGYGEEYDAWADDVSDWWYDDFDYDSTYDGIVEASQVEGAETVTYEEDFFNDFDTVFDQGYLDKGVENGSIELKSAGDQNWYYNSETGDVTLFDSSDSPQLFKDDGTIVTKLDDGGYIVQHPDRSVSVSDGSDGTGRIVTDENGDAVFKVQKGDRTADVAVGPDGSVEDRENGIKFGPNGEVDVRDVNVVKGGMAELIRRAHERPGQPQVGTDDHNGVAVVDQHGVYTETDGETDDGEQARIMNTGAEHPETGEEIVLEKTEGEDGNEELRIQGADKPINEMTDAELAEYGITRRPGRREGRTVYEFSNGRKVVQKECDGRTVYRAFFRPGDQQRQPGDRPGVCAPGREPGETPGETPADDSPAVCEVPTGPVADPDSDVAGEVEIESGVPDEDGGNEVKIGETTVASEDGTDAATITLGNGKTLELTEEGDRILRDENGEEEYRYNYLTGDYESDILSFNSNDPYGTAEFFGGSVSMSDAWGYGGGGYHYDGGHQQAEGVGAAEGTVVAGTNEANRIRGLGETVTGADLGQGFGIAGNMASAAGHMYAQYLITGDMQALIAFNRIMDARSELLGTLAAGSKSGEISDEMQNAGLVGGHNEGIIADWANRYEINPRKLRMAVNLALQEDGHLRDLGTHMSQV